MTRTKKLLWCIGSSANILSQKYLIITNMVQIYIILHICYIIYYIFYTIHMLQQMIVVHRHCFPSLLDPDQCHQPAQ